MPPGRTRIAWLALALCWGVLSSGAPLAAASFPEFVDPNPAPGNQFGALVVPLASGNVVITSPGNDLGATDAGAIYLFNGATGALISTLRASTANDLAGASVIALTNGNFVVCCPNWDNAGLANVGAVTWGNGTTGVSGVIGAFNSLVGSAASDKVGLDGVKALANGNYVVASPAWKNGAVSAAGAVTWCNGATGRVGAVGAANSVVGATLGDQLGSGGVTALSTGNYVIASPLWNNGAAVDAGAATWCNGETGRVGGLSAANSLVGSTSNNLVGGGGVTPLSNGNYVVVSPDWEAGATTDLGAVTWGNGTMGIVGSVGLVNSLFGQAASDRVGSGGVTPLPNGNYVVVSPLSNRISSVDVGAVTWGNGTAGVIGQTDVGNSLMGQVNGDQVGSQGVTALSNGNYVVASPLWKNGIADNAGAVTWLNGATGTTGLVTAANSLVGTTAEDNVGSGGVTALTNGNYVVSSPDWDNGGLADAGAVTWKDGTAGVTGTVSAANSLVGSSPGDQVGLHRVTALANGNYVVASGYGTVAASATRAP
jgi:hypothetical protein